MQEYEQENNSENSQKQEELKRLEEERIKKEEEERKRQEELKRLEDLKNEEEERIKKEEEERQKQAELKRLEDLNKIEEEKKRKEEEKRKAEEAEKQRQEEEERRRQEEVKRLEEERQRKEEEERKRQEALKKQVEEERQRKEEEERKRQEALKKQDNIIEQTKENSVIEFFLNKEKILYKIFKTENSKKDYLQIKDFYLHSIVNCFFDYLVKIAHEEKIKIDSEEFDKIIRIKDQIKQKDDIVFFRNVNAVYCLFFLKNEKLETFICPENIFQEAESHKKQIQTLNKRIINTQDLKKFFEFLEEKLKKNIIKRKEKLESIKNPKDFLDAASECFPTIDEADSWS